jgi:predicted ATPase
MPITLKARNFRGLRQLSWTPSGVCVLVGPNGSGKTTALSLFEFLHHAFHRGLLAAVDLSGGMWGLRHLQAPPDEPLSLALAIGDLRWELTLSVRRVSLDPHPGERITRGENLLLERAMFSDSATYQGQNFAWDGDRLGLQVLSDMHGHSEPMEPLTNALNAFRIYRGYHLSHLRSNGSLQSADSFLRGHGENAFSVLRNWHGRRELKARFDYVRHGVQAAFPEICDDIDFEQTSTTVTLRVFPPKSSDGVPVLFAPNGLLTGLLHLCAVAGAQPGSLIAIDEMENTLHPFAIRQLTAAFRDWAEEHHLTICLASHSPVLLDEFKDDPARIFVMEHGQDTLPVPLTELRDKEWLAQFSLGRLYAHGEFGSQKADSAPAPVA